MRHGRVTHGYPIFGTSGGVVWGWSFHGDANWPRFSFFLYTSFFLLWGSLALFEASHFTFLARSVVGTPFLKIFFTWPNLLGKHNHAPMFCLSKTEGSINNSICMAEAWTKQDQALKLAGEPNQWISIPTIDGLVCPERC